MDFKKKYKTNLNFPTNILCIMLRVNRIWLRMKIIEENGPDIITITTKHRQYRCTRHTNQASQEAVTKSLSLFLIINPLKMTNLLTKLYKIINFREHIILQLYFLNRRCLCC